MTRDQIYAIGDKSNLVIISFRRCADFNTKRLISLYIIHSAFGKSNFVILSALSLRPPKGESEAASRLWRGAPAQLFLYHRCPSQRYTRPASGPTTGTRPVHRLFWE